MILNVLIPEGDFLRVAAIHSLSLGTALPPGVRVGANDMSVGQCVTPRPPYMYQLKAYWII